MEVETWSDTSNISNSCSISKSKGIQLDICSTLPSSSPSWLMKNVRWIQAGWVWVSGLDTVEKSCLIPTCCQTFLPWTIPLNACAFKYVCMNLLWWVYCNPPLSFTLLHRWASGGHRNICMHVAPTNNPIEEKGKKSIWWLGVNRILLFVDIVVSEWELIRIYLISLLTEPAGWHI